MNNIHDWQLLCGLQTKAVLFDLDDTLVDRRAAVIQFSHYFADKYFADEDEETRQRVACSLVEFDRGNGRNHAEIYEQIYRLYGKSPMPEMKELIEFWDEGFAQFSHVFPCAYDLLCLLRKKGKKLVMLTNGGKVLQNNKIDAVNLRGYFDCIVISGEYGIHKPDKRIFDVTLQKSGLKADDCIFVGDDPNNDILGCKKAGMRGIWINLDNVEFPGEAGPFAEVKTLSDFYSAVKQWA